MIRLISAIDNKRGIAKNDVMPWNLPQDLARFRKLTMTDGGNVLLGRKTYELFGKYVHRHNFVVSHQDLDLPEDVTLVKDLDKFIKDFKEDIWVIGGAGIYEATIKYADELWLTIVDNDYGCDQFFPDYSDFKLKTSEGPLNENNTNFSYQLFVRN